MIMVNYKICVVIPTYNSGSFINSIFDSIKAQSIGFDDIQVIFADDKSDDDYTLDLLKSLDEEYSNVTSVFMDENSGFPGTGRNTGLKLSESKYIIFSDHDDTYNSDAFEVMYNAAEDENADMLITNYYKVYGDEKKKVETVFDRQNIVINDFKDDLRIFDLDPAIWCKLFRRDFLIENDIYFLERMLGEDLYVFIKSAVLSNCTVYLDDFYGYNYYIRNEKGNKSTIHIRNKKYLGKMVEGYHKLDEFLTDFDLEEYYSNIFNMHFVYWITSLMLSDISDEDKADLVKSNNDLLKKQVAINPGFGEKIYSSLTKPILEDDYKKVVKNLNSTRRYRRIAGKISKVLSR